MKRLSLTLGFLAALSFPAFAQLNSLLAPVVVSNGISQAGDGNLDRVVKRLEVESGRHLLDSDSLLAEVAKELAARYGVAGEIKLTTTRPWTTVQLPAEAFKVVLLDAPADGLSSSIGVQVRVVSIGETVGEWSMVLKVQLLQEMWASNGRIERGQALDRSLLTVQKIDVLRDRQSFIPADLDPSTLETAQAVTSPRLLMRRDILERPVIRKGQVVEVVAKQGAMAISMKALALEDGPAGALIKLRNIESHKEFSGQIVNESKVQILF